MSSEKIKDSADSKEKPLELGEYSFSVLRHPFRANSKELESAIGDLHVAALKAPGPEGNTYALLAANLISVKISKEHGKSSRNYKVLS